MGEQEQEQGQEQHQSQKQRAGVPAPHNLNPHKQNQDNQRRGVIPWIMAVAEDWESCRERRKKNPKRMGELSQAAFLLKAQSLGFGLAVPWGDSEKYDFIVTARKSGRLLRVQVKATGRLNCGGYDVQPVYSTRSEGKKTYTAEEIDVLAARVVLSAEDEGKEVWYLLPVEAILGVKSLRLFPDRKGAKAQWEEYREGWEWMDSGIRG